MGTYSWFVGARNDASGCVINWSSVDTTRLFKSRQLKHIYESPDRPTTLYMLAKQLDESKLMGYLTDEYIDALSALCRCLVPYGCSPRIYYDYEGADEVWAFEFVPGTELVYLMRYNYGHLVTDDTSDSHVQELLDRTPEKGPWTYTLL